MGYRIQYGKGATIYKTLIRPHSTARKRVSTSAVVIVYICLLFVFLYGKSDVVRRLILPGNAAVTEAALNELAENIREDGSLGNAITAFCLEIINNANLPE